MGSENEDNGIFRMEDQDSSIKEREKYCNELSRAVKHIQETVGSDNGWWLIGGLARDAIMGNDHFAVRNAKGELRDVDLLLTDENKHVAARIQQTNPSDLPIGTGFNNICSISKEKAELRFGGLIRSVPREVFTTQQTVLKGIEFPTMPPSTLFHMLAVGRPLYGPMREKDFSHALELGRYLRNHPDERLPEEDFMAFHEFGSRQTKLPGGLTQLIHRAGQAYMNSRFEKKASIRSPEIRRTLERLWDAAGCIDRRIG